MSPAKILILTALVSTLATEAHGQSVASRNWEDYPDFSALREEIGWSEDFSALCENDRPLKTMRDLIRQDDALGRQDNLDETIDIGLDWLNGCPIDVRVHFYTALSYIRLGQEAEAEVHKQWVNGLMESIIASGDGKTPETAYVTVSVNEEYDVLFLFGLEPTGQALIPGEVLVDELTATNEQGEEFIIYFNPAAHFARLETIF